MSLFRKLFIFSSLFKEFGINSKFSDLFLVVKIIYPEEGLTFLNSTFGVKSSKFLLKTFI